MNPLILIAGTALATAAPFIGHLVVTRRREAKAESQDWMELTARPVVVASGPAAAAPVDPAAIEAGFDRLRAQISDLAHGRPVPFMAGDPVRRLSDGTEGTVVRPRVAPPELLVDFGPDLDEPEWVHPHEVERAE